MCPPICAQGVRKFRCTYYNFKNTPILFFLSGFMRYPSKSSGFNQPDWINWTVQTQVLSYEVFCTLHSINFVSTIRHIKLFFNTFILKVSCYATQQLIINLKNLWLIALKGATSFNHKSASLRAYIIGMPISIYTSYDRPHGLVVRWLPLVLGLILGLIWKKTLHTLIWIV